MKTFKLRGLAEGLVGQSSVKASSVSNLFSQFPVLKSYKSKLQIRGGYVAGFSACDG